MSGALLYNIYQKPWRLLCPTVVWDTITNTEHYQAHTHAHKLPFTHVLLYMQPKHNYKIKHRGHFKIKAQYLLERGLVPLYYIHVIVCCCWEAVWSFAVVPEADLGQRLGFSEVRWRNGGGRKQEEDEILCRERKLSEIRMLMDGSSSFESSIVYFLHCIHPEKLVLGSCPHRSFYTRHSSTSNTTKNLNKSM